MRTTIDLLRHGEPVGGKRYRGHQDDPLSETGWKQMEHVIDPNVRWDAILTSPLKRCADFAHSLSLKQSLPLFVEPRLLEISFGAWEGRTAEELIHGEAEQLYAFWADPFNHPPPGGEPLAAFLKRTLSAWNRIQTEWQDKHILVICHAGTIRMIFCHLLGLPVVQQFNIQVDYASLSRVVIEGDDDHVLARLVSHQGGVNA
jgi:alpha-ribazole phosphatase/probable phosphoglycerate mutase